MNTIICPNCKKPVEISEAISKQFEEEKLAELEEQYKKDLLKAVERTEADAQKKMTEQFEFQLKRLQEDTKDKDERNKLLLEQITEMTKEVRASKKEKDEAMLEMQKKLSQEEGKIREEERKKAEEMQHGKLQEKEKQLQDALKEAEEMKRKLQQGSQQLQGEAFELEFEQLLQQQYPHDKILPVGKGVRGADIVQEVWDSNGEFAGKILWELKNTKTWSEPWIDKLKGDKREINADEAVIITEVMPQSMKIAGFRKGVWITERPFVVPLTDSLRVKLIQQTIIKKSLKGKDMKMELLYTYLTGTEFKNRIEALVEAFGSMQTEIEKEKRYFANKWARDEKNIRQVIDNTYGMHGDLKGILAAAVPQIQGMELLDSGESS